jgi:CubicO group peptidase (beta-lactamase class C family)
LTWRAVALIVLCAGAFGLSARARPAAAPEWVRKADGIARRAVSEGRAAGLSVFARQRGKTWISRGYGVSDLENNVPASPDTVYAIASVSKQFTAAAVLQLAEAGRLTLDDELTKYLPDYPVRGNRVTVGQLLNHTSGIRNMTALGAPYWSQIARDASPDDVIRIFENEPFDFVPGEGYAYSNSGYFLLGVIIEKASGVPYGEYLTKNVFPPAGLEHTYSCAGNGLVPHRARGYSRGGAGFVNAKYFSQTQGFSVGGVCSTAPDLARWVEALASGRVVRPASFQQMTTPAVLPSGERLTYGFGTGVGENEGHRVFYHSGGIFGFDAMEAFYPQDSLTVVVLSNTDGEVAGEIENAVARLALGIAPPADRPVPAALAATCVGAYRIGGALIQVRDRDGRLSIEMPGEKAEPLLFREGESFSLGTGPVIVRFVLAGGTVRELRLTQYGATRFDAKREQTH